MRIPILFLLALSFLAVNCYSADEKIDIESFLSRNFEGQSAQVTALWLSVDTKNEILKRFDYRVDRLRVRYWAAGEKTAWVLDEVGKERPITIGVVIDGAKVARVEVLAYRESRGGEIRYPFFLDQFKGAQLEVRGKKSVLSTHIDGITGATLSVKATKKVAMAALFLHKLALYP